MGRLGSNRFKVGDKVFLGEYTHTLDAKNRLFIPALFRDELGSRFVLCKSSGGTQYLTLFSEKKFEEYFQAIKENYTLHQRRYALLDVLQAESDKAGRITVSQKLCDYAGLKKNVIVYGNGDRIEIWNEESWNAEVNRAEGEDMEVLLPELRF